MTIGDTVYVEFIYSILIVALEVPSGLWADRFRRKDMIVLSALFNAFGYVLLLVAYGFPLFALANVLSAIHGALSSGSVNALLYESLQESNLLDRFEKVLSHVKIIRYASGLMAALMGAFAADQFGFLFNYQISLGSAVLAFVTALSLEEPLKRGLNEEESVQIGLKPLMILTYRTLTKSDSLRRIILLSASVGGAIVYFEEFWQNYFFAIGTKSLYFGLVSAFMSISVIVASAMSPRITLYLRKYPSVSRRYYKGAIFILAFCYLLVGFVHSVYALFFMCLALGLAALNENRIYSDIHHQVNSANRATMESVYSMVERLLVTVFGLIFAWSSDGLNVFWGFIAIGFLLLGIAWSIGVCDRLNTLKSYKKWFSELK